MDTPPVICSLPSLCSIHFAADNTSYLLKYSSTSNATLRRAFSSISPDLPILTTTVLSGCKRTSTPVASESQFSPLPSAPSPGPRSTIVTSGPTQPLHSEASQRQWSLGEYESVMAIETAATSTVVS